MATTFLIALGVGIMALNEPLITKICFGVSAAILGVKIILLGVVMQQTFLFRSAIVGISFAAVGILLTESFRWVDGKQLSQRQQPATADPLPNKPANQSPQKVHIEQRTEGPQSPTIVGNNATVNYGPPTRSLSTSKKESLIASLSKFPGTKFKLLDDSSEEKRYVADILEVAKASKWQIIHLHINKNVAPYLTAPPVTGTLIVATNAAKHPAADALVDGLGTDEAQLTIRDTQNGEDVRILIGPMKGKYSK